MFPPMQQPPSYRQLPPSPGPPSSFGRPFQGSGGIQPRGPGSGGGLQGILQRFMPGVAQTGYGGGGITQMLGNVQHVLKMAQSVAPIAQQYGPMIKNLPAMMKMMKAFNESDEDEGNEETETEKDNSTHQEQSNQGIDKKTQQTNIQSTPVQDKQTSKSTSFTESSGTSTPKLYI